MPWCVFVQAPAAAPVAAYRWNIMPVNVDSVPDTVWEWHYPRFPGEL